MNNITKGMNQIWRKLLTESSGKTWRSSHVLQIATNRYSTSSKKQHKLAIFDKDGTLTSFDAMWAGWCEETASRLENISGKRVSDIFYDFLNFNKVTKEFGRSKLAHDTNAVLKEELAEILVEKHGIDRDDSKSYVSYAWTDTFTTDNDCHTNSVKPLGDVQTVFRTLKDNGIKIAVCTSDTRPSAVLALETLGVSDMVDRLVCGDDPDNTRKPAPDNIHLICDDLDVKVEDTAMIGDTHFDTIMGRDSNCRTVIGILSGQNDLSELEDAHFVVNSIDEALPILIDNITSSSDKD